MIGEPELDGEWGPAGPAEVVRNEPERPRGAARPPWVWVLATALAVSALWALGLYAFGERLAAPPVPYRTTRNLCQDFRAEELGKIAGDLHRHRPENQESSHRAVDGALCRLRSGESVSTLVVQAQADLHRRTDPAAEFDVPLLGQGLATGAEQAEPVTGLGERALFLSIGEGEQAVLKVLDGGAVFTVQAFGFRNADGVPSADPAALRAALIEDTRRLMAELRT
ncbi:hypothetical protein [Streptomyces sp. NPDC047014]|uniref:hypothetical protein n=1 Tax=Streptomyces sp. NPDC047014 TaxID=3155736 RepID=UPI0033E89560